jgi:hypothetical protein
MQNTVLGGVVDERPKMRERLAVARARSNYDVVGAAAMGDALGNLLLRGIDNHDSDALRRAKFTLASNLSQHSRMHITRANRMVRDVLIYLIDQRCPTCSGQAYIRQDTSVRACPACAGAGLVGSPPMHWRKYHRLVLAEAQGSMGRALKTARDAANSA